MKTFIFLLCVAHAFASVVRQDDWNTDWESWKAKHAKVYAHNEEELKRKTIWEKNLHLVTKHNYEYDLGQHTYTLEMNKFADLEAQEFRNMYLSSIGFERVSTHNCSKGSFYSMDFGNLPAEVDWTTKGYVTPVKNQGQCGSCWAFSTTGSVEGQHFKKTGKLVSLSEQNLVDCSGPEGDLACLGGLMDYAFDYIIENNGIDTEASYPYVAKKQECMFNRDNVGATISSCVDLPSTDEGALQKAVAEVGPISVAIDASHVSFQLYGGGVYSEPGCSATQLDHGVLAAGYGTLNGADYWLVKNSWGEDWGMKGYIKMSRNNNNNCGIATQASYPVV